MEQRHTSRDANGCLLMKQSLDKADLRHEPAVNGFRIGFNFCLKTATYVRHRYLLDKLFHTVVGSAIRILLTVRRVVSAGHCRQLFRAVV